MVLVNLDLGKIEDKKVETLKKKWKENKKDTIRKIIRDFKEEEKNA